jgi:hypothetical protein
MLFGVSTTFLPRFFLWLHASTINRIICTERVILMLFAAVVEKAEPTWLSVIAPNVFFILLFGGIAIMGIVAIAGAYWLNARKASLDAKLKEDMLERGMSADDIVKVIQARPQA